MKLREKDNKLHTLESDLKTTSVREIRIANDIMKQEIQRLNECLMSKGNYQNLLSDRDTNRSNLFLNNNNNNNKENNSKNGTEIELKALKDENQRLIERLQKLLNEESTRLLKEKKLRDENEKYKSEIERLKKANKQYQRISSSSSSSSSSSARNSKSSSGIKNSLVSIVSDSIKRKPSPSPSTKDSNYDFAVDTLQSVFRGHAERLKFNNDYKSLNSKDLKPIKKELIDHKKKNPSPSRNKIDSPSLSRHNSNESLSKGNKKNETISNKLNTSLKQLKSNKSFNDEDDVSMD